MHAVCNDSDLKFSLSHMSKMRRRGQITRKQATRSKSRGQTRSKARRKGKSGSRGRGQTRSKSRRKVKSKSRGRGQTSSKSRRKGKSKSRGQTSSSFDKGPARRKTQTSSSPAISELVKACRDPIKQKYLKASAKGFLRSRDPDDWGFVATKAHYLYLREQQGLDQEDAERVAKVHRVPPLSSFGNC